MAPDTSVSGAGIPAVRWLLRAGAAGRLIVARSPRARWVAGGVVLIAVAAVVLSWAAGARQSSIEAAFTEPVALSDRLLTLTTIFLGIFIEALPFLLLGALASGFVEVFVRPEALTRWLPRHPLLAALAGAGLGIVLPVCECGIVVVVRRLLAKGLPLPVGIAFLLAAPVVNPIVFAATLAAFGLGKMLVARFALSFGIATVIALLFATARRDQVLAAGRSHRPHDHAHGHHHPPHHEHHAGSGRRNLLQHLHSAVAAAAGDLFDVGRYLVAGSLLAAALQALVPQDAILEVAGGAVSSVLVLSLLAFVISVCSTVDAFVALSFVGTFTPASILAFLVFGPMVDIKSALMFSSVFRSRVVAYLIALPLGCTLVAALLLATQVGF